MEKMIKNIAHEAHVSMILFMVLSLAYSAQGSSVPALFIFGDSLVDTGNNNHFITPVRANFPPYGCSFAHSEATGRFSDGRLIIDFLASYVALPSPPGYFAKPGGRFLRGANFGSAGSGVFAWTQNVMKLSDQVNHFENLHNVFINIKGNQSTLRMMSKSLFIICTGNEDAKLMLTMTVWNFSWMRTQLLEEMHAQIKKLYELGARRFLVSDVNALGCAPSRQTFGMCNMHAIYRSAIINFGLARLLVNLQSDLNGSMIVHANLGNLIWDVKLNPSVYGFKNTVQGCCPLYEPLTRCYLDAEFCEAPFEFMFWDLENPTEALNQVIARQWWNGSTRYVAPFNLATLLGPAPVPHASP